MGMAERNLRALVVLKISKAPSKSFILGNTSYKVLLTWANDPFLLENTIFCSPNPASFNSDFSGLVGTVSASLLARQIDTWVHHSLGLNLGYGAYLKRFVLPFCAWVWKYGNNFVISDKFWPLLVPWLVLGLGSDEVAEVFIRTPETESLTTTLAKEKLYLLALYPDWTLVNSVKFRLLQLSC